ncbi:MAG: hypothetical protein KIT82_18300 [Bradyrhizobium sp.]|nr:hypothetical protein [Bradyrhizobium sp.]
MKTPDRNGFVVPLYTDCARFLRATYNNLPGGRLGAGHAHELVAAYFGYSDGSALRAESKYPLTASDEADILIPDIPRMAARMHQLALPAGMPAAGDVAAALTGFLTSGNHFTGRVWLTDNLEEYIGETFIQENAMIVMDELSGEMASTNAYFDELYPEEVSLDHGSDELIATVTGSLNGENDPDRPFSGTSISFESVITFPRVAGRVFYASPEIATGGAVADKDMRDPDDM